MEDRTDTDRAPNPIDVHVGARVRMRRKMKGISQEALAGKLKLTFQQVQKYERGTNRISASKLYEIARALDVTIGDFFEGLDDTRAEGGVSEPATPYAHAMMLTPDGIDLATAFGKLRRGKVRKRLVELVKALANEDASESDAEG
jgi:transcriptional regulator with XRE-family HTH domain